MLTARDRFNTQQAVGRTLASIGGALPSMAVYGCASEASRGLVPSINKSETTENQLCIDKLQARCTRLRKNLGVAAKWLSQSGFRAWMLTFTYRDDQPWQPKHMSEALMHLRKWLKRAYGCALRYVWVMETKARKSGEFTGSIREHYHCVVWVPHQVTQDDLRMDERGYWPHGMTNAVVAKAAVRYVMKYASKFDNEGSFPKGARCYGVGGMDSVGGRIRRWINWPSFVQARAAITDTWRRAVGGGWTDAATGEWLPSEYGLSFSTKSHSVCVRLHDHGRPLDVGGPFNWISSNLGGSAAPGLLH